MICPRCETSVRPGKSDNTQFHLVEGNCVFASSPCCCVLACAGVVLCRIAAVMALLLTPVKKKHADVYPVLFSRTIFFFFFVVHCAVLSLCSVLLVKLWWCPCNVMKKKHSDIPVYPVLFLQYSSAPVCLFTVVHVLLCRCALQRDGGSLLHRP